MLSGLGVIDFTKKIIQTAKDRMDKSIFRNYDNYQSKTTTLLDSQKTKNISRPNLMHKKIEARRKNENIKIIILAIFTFLIVVFIIYYWFHSVSLVYGN